MATKRTPSTRDKLKAQAKALGVATAENTPIEALALTDDQIIGETPINEAALPRVSLDDPNINRVAARIIGNLPPNKIFRRDETYVTVKAGSTPEEDGTVPIIERAMTARRLCSYLADYIYFERGQGDNVRQVGLSKEQAEKILASDVWYERAPHLELILPVRLPVWGEKVNGKRTIKLAEPGYDPKQQTYTAETLNYATDKRYTPAQITAAWDRIAHGFPWGPEGEQEEWQVWKLRDQVIQGPRPSLNRSACCCFALMLGQYCRLLINDLMPIGLFNANQRGSGKTLLAWLCVSPVWGIAAGTPHPKNDEEMIKHISAALLGRAPYHLMDDIPSLNNNTINMVATSNRITGRVLGTLGTFTAKNHMQLFATGNALKTSTDVERRSLIIDLFLADLATDRKFSNPLTQKSLARPEYRADLLRIMQAAVMNWGDAGCPELTPGSSKPTFETYASIIGSIMKFNGFGNPFAERMYDGAGGDMITKAILKLLALIVTEKMENVKTALFTVTEIVDFANEYHLTEAIAGNKNPNYSFGRKFEDFRGRKLKDINGRPFEFGRRKESMQSCYTFTRLDV